MIGIYNTQVPNWIQRLKSWKTGELLQPRIPPLLSDLLQETYSDASKEPTVCLIYISRWVLKWEIRC